MSSYKTIKERTAGFYKEKGSRFLSFAFPVNSEEEIKEILLQLKKEYHDARHICYAWILGENRQKMKSGDDGEPAGTAGKPILNQLLHTGCTNVLVAVVRYFGGTLLGTGGLANAYKTAAADALSKAVIEEKTEMLTLQITFPYERMNQIMSLLKSEGVKPSVSYLDQQVVVTFTFPCEETGQLTPRFSLYADVEIKIL